MEEPALVIVEDQDFWPMGRVDIASLVLFPLEQAQVATA
jgi:hypothetical protein